MALPRNKRIVRDQDFAAIMKKGKTVRGSFFFIKFNTQPHQAENRFSVVVPSRVAARAVRRNAIRRAVTEEFRVMKIPPLGLDVVCFVQKNPPEDLALMRREFYEKLSQIL